jgi:hypothetical protein
LSSKQSIIVIFILMTFVSQAFASVILPCPSDMRSMASKYDVINTAATNACHHQLMSDTDLDNQTSSDSFDCCDNQCDCPTGSCFSIALKVTVIQSVKISKLIGYISDLTTNTMPQHNVSLYRPPILSC